MVELIGDKCEPSTFVLPHSTAETVSGSLVVSGSTLVYISGSTVWTVDVKEL